MPRTLTDEGLRAAAELRAEFPSLAVPVLSQHVEPAAALTLLGSTPTAVGQLLKEHISDVDEFVANCRTVAAGGSVIDPIVTEQLMVKHCERAALDGLSVREQEVMALVAREQSGHLGVAVLFGQDRGEPCALDLPEGRVTVLPTGTPPVRPNPDQAACNRTLGGRRSERLLEESGCSAWPIPPRTHRNRSADPNAQIHRIPRFFEKDRLPVEYGTSIS